MPLITTHQASILKKHFAVTFEVARYAYTSTICRDGGSGSTAKEPQQVEKNNTTCNICEQIKYRNPVRKKEKIRSQTKWMLFKVFHQCAMTASQLFISAKFRRLAPSSDHFHTVQEERPPQTPFFEQGIRKALSDESWLKQTTTSKALTARLMEISSNEASWQLNSSALQPAVSACIKSFTHGKQDNVYKLSHNLALSSILPLL